MTLTVHNDIEQRSEKWYAARRGIVTASVVGKLISVGKLSAIDYTCPKCDAPVSSECRNAKGDGTIKTVHPERSAKSAAEKKNSPTILETASNEESRGLTLELAAERITGYTEPTFITSAMWRGIEDEPRAVDLYSERYAPVQTVGFMVRQFDGFSIGYSPDGLVGADGLIEVKSRNQRKQLQTVLADAVPFADVAQVQCGLLVSGREWLDFLSYSGGMAMWKTRVYPDDRWQKAILDAVRIFENNVTEIVATYKQATEGLPMTERPVNLDELRIA